MFYSIVKIYTCTLKIFEAYKGDEMIRSSTKWLSMSLFNNKSMFAFFEPLIQMVFANYNVIKYRAKVLQVQDENSGVYTLSLKVSRLWKGFKSGQFVELQVEQDGANISRFFSISSSPRLFKSHRIIELTIQKQELGRITPWLRETLVEGQYLSISSAKGEFCIQDNSKPMLFIAAGSGITPFKSMLTDLPENANIQLLYYAKESKHIFVQELVKYANSFQNINITFIKSNVSGRFGLNHLQTYCPDFNQRIIFICGPGEMIESTKNLLRENHVANENINYEYFGAKPIKNLGLKTSGMVSFNQSTIEVLSNNKSQKTLLQLAESSGLKPITGCRMGICHQCICQKEQGVVYNLLTQSYSDTGPQEVQLCVSVPVGDVSINL